MVRTHGVYSTPIGQRVKKHSVYSSVGQYRVRKQYRVLPRDNSGTGHMLCTPYNKVRIHGMYSSRTHVVYSNRTIRHILCTLMGQRRVWLGHMTCSPIGQI